MRGLFVDAASLLTAMPDTNCLNFVTRLITLDRDHLFERKNRRNDQMASIAIPELIQAGHDIQHKQPRCLDCGFTTVLSYLSIRQSQY